MRLEDIRSADFKAQPWWWEAAPPAERGTGPPPAETDVAVIGSGYAGLCAALELERNGAHATVLEAGVLGGGASTRNGGMVSGGINVAKGVDLARRYGAERARALFEDGIASYEFLEDLIARERIECSYSRSGRFVPAHSPGAYERLARRAEALAGVAALGIEMLPRSRQHEELASDWYHGGMLVRRAGGLHPALYHRGLLERCRTAGVTLCANAPVQRIESRNGSAELITGTGGRVRAREVVVASNAYTGPVLPWHRRRLIPAVSYMIATEDLGEARVRELFPNARMIADSKRDLYYFRPAPDGRRVLFGSRAGLTQPDAAGGAPALYGNLCRVFPQLRGVRITHAWSGNVAMTFDRLPHTGVHRGLHYALGCNGSGVAMMGYLGHQSALRILGRANRRCAFEGIPFDSRPLYGGRPWFVPAASAWYRLLDRAERVLR